MKQFNNSIKQSKQKSLASHTKQKISKVTLIGFMGSGKSSVGKKLAAKRGLEYIEMDDLTLKKSGRNSISEIFEKDGEEEFRRLEAEVADNLSNKTNCVIATGGGVGANEHVLNLLRRNGIVIYLKTEFETVKKRIRNFNSRPLFKNLTTAQELYETRMPLYQKNADEIISTDGKTVSQIVEEVLNIIIKAKTQTKLCFVIGDPIAHSLSPIMHTAGYHALEIQSEFLYQAKKVTKEKLEQFVKSVRASGICGVSVTIPHKTEIMTFLDEISPEAKDIGAVNTVINENGILKGYNTDWIGVLKPLEHVTNLQNKMVAIIGAGGAARAMIYAAKKAKAHVVIFNRTFEHAKKLADELRISAKSFDKLPDIQSADIILNATSVGLNSDESPIPKEYLEKSQIIFDAVYNPYETRLLKDAKDKGATIIQGSEMLLYQGAEQFKLFTKHDAPIEEMRKALEKQLIH